jgi:protease I
VLINEFETRNVERVCRLSADTIPLLIISVGFPAEQESREGATVKPASVERNALLIVPSANFRDEEFFGTQKILTEAGIKVIFASSNIGILHGMSGRIIYSEITLDKIRIKDFSAVVFIGGTGATEYFNDSLALEIAQRAAADQKVLAAISTAPAILANAGVLKGVRATSFLSERGIMIKGGATYTGTSLERDGLFITSSDSSATTSFARAIVAAIADTDRH